MLKEEHLETLSKRFSHFDIESTFFQMDGKKPKHLIDGILLAWMHPS